MNLQTDVHGAVDRQKAKRFLTVIGEGTVSCIVDNDNPVLPGKTDHLLKEFRCGDCACRIVGIVYIKHPCLPQDLIRY